MPISNIRSAYTFTTSHSLTRTSANQSYLFRLPPAPSSSNNSTLAYHLLVISPVLHPSPLFPHNDRNNSQFAPIAFLKSNVTSSSSRSLRSLVCTSTAYVRMTCLTWPDWKLILALRMILVLGPGYGVSRAPLHCSGGWTGERVC
jgi:hypothetical protein